MGTALTKIPPRDCENLLILSPWAPGRVECALRNQGVQLGGCGMVPINASPVRYDGDLWTADAVAPSDLTGLSMRYCEAMRHVEPGTGWVLVDNAQVLMMYADAREVARLTQQAKERNVAGVVAVDRDAVQPETLTRLGTLLDTGIER